MTIGPELGARKLGERVCVGVQLLYLDWIDSDQGAMLADRLQGVEGGDLRSSLDLILLQRAL